ncbi:MAG TPA: SPFH/Band 7/PHB domain protein, partial [Verrucomicrobiae bacterium]
MDSLKHFVIAYAVTIVVFSVFFPILLAFLRFFGLYTIVNEGRCKVYVLFGKVVGQINEPGLHFLPGSLGAAAFIVN